LNSIILGTIFVTVILLSSVLTSNPLVFNNQNQAFAENGGTNKIIICHIPSGNPDNAHVITVSEKALDAHLAHGDTLGNCPQLLADEYLELIGKLNDVGVTLDTVNITQELIDSLRSDLIRLEEIVQELSSLGFEVTITINRVEQQMIGTISFSDVVTSELLFDIQIPDGTMAILFAIGITDEFLDDGEMLTFEEQATFLSGGLSIVNSITNFEDDEIASNFVLAILEAFHIDIVTIESFSASVAQAAGKGAAIREAIKACLKNSLCKEAVFQGSEVTVKQLIEGKWITIIISGFVFNDINNDGIIDENERTPNEIFELFMFDPKILGQVGFTTSNPADGQFAFDEDILFAPLPLIIVQEVLTDLQIDNGWIHSTPDSVSIPVPQQLPSSGTFVDDSTVFGNHQIITSPPPQFITVSFGQQGDENIEFVWIHQDPNKNFLDGDKIIIEMVSDTSNDSGHVDLGVGNISDDAWELSFNIKFDDSSIKPPGTDNNRFLIGLGDKDSSVSRGGTHDYLGITFENRTGIEGFGAEDTNNGSIGLAGEDEQLLVWENNVEYVIKIIRESPTAYKVQVFKPVPGGLALAGEANGATTADLSNLRYFVLRNNDGINNPVNGVWSGEISNIFFRNLNVAPDTDCEKTTMFDMCAIETQQQADSIWIHQDPNKNLINPFTKLADLDLVADTSNDNAHVDLGLGTVSNDSWELKFRLYFIGLEGFSSENNRFLIGLGDKDGSVSRGGTHDFLGAVFENRPGIEGFGAEDTNNGSIGLAGEDEQLFEWQTNTSYFVKIERSSPTTYSIELASDELFENVLAQANGATTADLKDLRYFVVRNNEGINNPNTGEWVGFMDEIKFRNLT